jgi:hypothetical protein
MVVVSDLGWVLRPVIHTASACLTTTEIGLVKNNGRPRIASRCAKSSFAAAQARGE